MTPNPEAVRALLVASVPFAYACAAGLDAPAAPLATPQGKCRNGFAENDCDFPCIECGEVKNTTNGSAQ